MNRAITLTAMKATRQIIPASHHAVDHMKLSRSVDRVLDTLTNAGYQAYLVGGGVRDLLLGITPKDFDVATDARPEQVKKIFGRCRLIGRRFRLAHVYVGNDMVEVSTFRAADHTVHRKNGVIIHDNVYGTLEDDVWRRDFTANALYYNGVDRSIVDYVGGINDISHRQLKIIGNASDRYREDPVRMLRAMRLASKLNFSIHTETQHPILHLAVLLKQIPTARLFEECLKIFTSGCAAKIYPQLCKQQLFGVLFPQTDSCLKNDDHVTDRLLRAAFRNTDLRLAKNQHVTPSFLLAALLWTPTRNLVHQYVREGLTEKDAIELASERVIAQQSHSTSMPKRLTIMAKNIWRLQSRLIHTRRNSALELLKHRYFRAAYDLLELRAEAGDIDADLVEWWTTFQQEHPDIRPPLRKRRAKNYR